MKNLIPFLMLVLASPGFGEQVQTFFNPQSEVTCDTNGELLVAANPRRRYLLLQNKGSVAIYVKAGSAPTPTAGVRLDAGAYWEMDAKTTPQALYCATASSTSVTVVQEGN